MLVLEISVLLLCSKLTFSKFCISENPCKCVLPDNSVIDLSHVGSPGFPRFSDVLFDVKCSAVFSYNPCFAFISPNRYTYTNSTHQGCAGASACVKGFGGTDGKPPEEHAIGIQHTAIFDKVSDKTYINYTVPGSSEKLHVELQCNWNGTSDDYELFMAEPKECSGDAKEFDFILKSRCACPNGCLTDLPKEPSPGLSTGSKLLIAFFTILIAYLLIGIVWNYCNGAQGSELVPNLQFWNDLPTLIMEGVAFTCSCCGRQSTYGEV